MSEESIQPDLPFDGDLPELDFDFAPDVGPLGILSNRPWCRIGDALDGEIADLRRHVPLDRAISDHLLRLLIGRGLTDGSALEAFFYPSQDEFHDPFTLREMDGAVDCLLRATAKGARVAVHGDFDVDGITGAALLTEVLEALTFEGGRISTPVTFLPDRGRDGYGVASGMIRQWATEGIDLLLTVDTGTAAVEEITLARELGMDVVVLDHHIFDERPPANALVNPRRGDATYVNQDLCGVAVAFKLVQALRIRDEHCLPEGFEDQVIDLVALGLVADQMMLVGENRALVRRGLSRIEDRKNPRPGLAALLSVAGLDRGFPVTATDLAYQIAPRLNACGRVGEVGVALKLMLCRDEGEAKELAAVANRTNDRRKHADKALKDEAIEMAAPFVAAGDPGLVLASKDWHKGVIGIGAARLVEQYQLPTILLAVEDDSARGSVRSIANIDVKNVLDCCADLLVRHGGHAQAAGLTIRSEHIDELRQRFNEVLADNPRSGPSPKIFELDLPLAEMSAADVADLVGELEYLEPFGAGNRKPLFRCRGLRMSRPPQMLGGGAHLRFSFAGDGQRNGGGTPALSRNFVSFGSGEAWRRWYEGENGGRRIAARRWDVLFQLSRSTFRPRGGLYDPVQQLLVDLRPAHEE